MKLTHIFVGFVCTLAIVGCKGSLVELPVETVILTGPAGQTVTVEAEIADDDAERQKGLMGRERLPEGTGMLFVFTTDEVRSFWMKDTLVPLDVLFFNQHGVFVSSSTMEPCTADPCMSYPSVLPARYALEVPKGFVESTGIGIGWKLELHP